MRYCTLFLFSLLFTANAFGQSDSIQTLPTRIVIVDSSHGHILRLNPTRPRYTFTCIPLTSNKIAKTTPPIVTVNYEEHSLPVGLPTNPFRFQNVNQIANTQAGVFSIDGSTPSILGGRTEGTAYFFNGVRVMDNLPAPRPLNPVDDTKPTP